MNAPFTIRTKLSVAAVSLVALIGLDFIYNIGPFGGTIVFKIGAFVLAAIIAFEGIFRRAFLSLLWGWALAFYTAFGVVILGCGLVPSGDRIWFALSVIIATVGTYVLLVDGAVRDYRKSIP